MCEALHYCFFLLDIVIDLQPSTAKSVYRAVALLRLNGFVHLKFHGQRQYLHALFDGVTVASPGGCFTSMLYECVGMCM